MGFWDGLVGVAKDVGIGLANSALAPVRGVIGMKAAAYSALNGIRRGKDTDIINKSSKQIDFSKLEIGDILVKQMDPNSLDSDAIRQVQLASNDSHKYLGASDLTHALLYVGNGNVIEAVKKGIGISSLKGESYMSGADYSHYTFFVLRCNNPEIAKLAVKAAEDFVKFRGDGLAPFDVYTEKTKVTNDYIPIMELAAKIMKVAGSQSLDNPFRGQFINPNKVAAGAASKRTDDVYNQLQRGEKVALFCSELVVYCYHRATDMYKPGHRRFFGGYSQDHVSPEEIYVFARDDAEFSYQGRLPAGKR